MISRLAFAILLLCLWSAPALAQSTATITAKTCTLTMSAAKSPDGTSGWTVQFKRGTSNHGQVDSTAPYGPKSADVVAGVYAVTALWTKAGVTVTEAIGTATCQNGTVVFVATAPPPPPPPPAEVCGDGIDNDQDGLIDEGCAPPPVEVCGDGVDNDKDGQVDEGCPVPPPPTGGSPDGTIAPPALSITDSKGAVWTFGDQVGGLSIVLRHILRNGERTNVYGSEMRYLGGFVYVYHPGEGQWIRWDEASATWQAVAMPGSSVGVPVSKAKTLAFTPNADEFSAVTSFVMRVMDGAGSIAQTVNIPTPTLSAAGDAAVPVTLSLLVGHAYRLTVQACTMVCGPDSDAFTFVF